ncbi:MAG: diaminopimelate epimerase [Clostridia bacterium]|nr:diaminopimelate epimerase [Clostridia bacterium]
MHFTKMEGLGNDYLYHFGEIDNPAKVSIKLSERHFGIGSDGIILIDKSDKADFKMRIFNADGSEAKMCGNGIRCVGKYVYDKGYTDKTDLEIETLSGIKYLKLNVSDAKVKSVRVNMGKAEVSERAALSVNGGEISTVPVSTGNPHTVTFVENAAEVPLEKIGPALEKHPFFPDGVNAEFAQVIDKNTIRMRVWERGSGITMACGTGSCATVAAAVSLGYCRKNEEVSVILDGGTLVITILDDGTVIMQGPATTVCECEVDL